MHYTLTKLPVDQKKRTNGGKNLFCLANCAVTGQYDHL